MNTSRILVGHDGSPHADDALALAQVLADATHAELVIGRILQLEPIAPSAVPLAEIQRQMEEQQQLAARELEGIAERHGAKARVHAAASRARGLYELAEEVDARLVVVGSSHRGLIGQALAGNVAIRMLEGMSCPVAVAPAGYADAPKPLRVIGAGFDGASESRAAVEAAGQLASVAGAELRIITAVPPVADLAANPWVIAWQSGGADDDRVQSLTREAEAAQRALPDDVRSSLHVGLGTPTIALLDAASELDLLVLGSRGYGPARRLLLGSVSSRIVREARCPVLVVPRPASTEAEAERNGRQEMPTTAERGA